MYRNIINRFCEEAGKTGISYGDMPAVTLRHEHVIKLMAARAERPDAANGLRKALLSMMAHAVQSVSGRDDPTQGVKAIKPKSHRMRTVTNGGSPEWHADPSPSQHGLDRGRRHRGRAG